MSPAQITALMSDIRAAAVAMEQELTTGVNAYPYFSETQADFPFWANDLSTVSAVQIGTTLFEMTLRLSAYFHVDAATAGIDGDSELAGQIYLVQFPIQFAARELLNSAAYPSGPKHLQAIANIAAAMVRVNRSGAETRAIKVSCDLPLILSIETEY